MCRVAGDFFRDGPFQPFSRGFFSRFRKTGVRYAQSPVRDGGQGQRADARGCAQVSRFARGFSFRERQPAAAERSVDPVGLPGLGEHILRGMKRNIVMCVACRSMFRAECGEFLFRVVSVRVRVRVEVHGDRFGLCDQFRHLFRAVAFADHEGATN